MHILQLVPTLEVGGVERGVVDLAAGLIQRGHRVSVVSAGGALVEPLRRLGATHYTIPIDRKAPWAVWRAVPALCQFVRDTQVDLIHARSRVPAWAGYVAAWRTQVPFLTTCHGFYAPHPASRVMTWGRRVIAPSQVLGRYLIDHFGVAPERVRVIPRGVDLGAFRFHEPPQEGSRPWRIGLIGRITALKGHEVAIRALHLLIQQRCPVRLCVIGDAPSHKSHLRARLMELARSLGVESAVEWLGTRDDIPTCLASLDAVIVPSTYPESFGRSVIEAQAVGVPVIASRIGALAEIIEHERTGVLITPGDPTELAQAIRRVMQEDLLRSRLIRQARQRVEEQFSLERMVEATLAVYHECLAAPRIVIWKLSAAGDVVLATPSFRAIRRQFPESPITLVVGRAVYELVARCPYADDVVIYDHARRARTLAGKLKFLRRLRRDGFDLSIDLQNSRLTHLLAWAAGIPVRVGYDRRWGWLLNRAVPLPQTPMAPVAHQQHLLQAAGFIPDGDALELWPSESDAVRADQWLRQAGIDLTRPVVGLHIGGSPRWKTKRWALSQWAALCDRLSSQGIQAVITGTVADRGLGEQLQRLVRSTPLMAVGQTSLTELACLIHRCQVFVTTDSAPLHIAAAVGTPTVALFGPTDPARHVPASSAVRVIKKDVFCSPCYSTWCRTITHACMRQIRVEDVARVIEERLKIADCGMRIVDLPSINPKSEIHDPKSA